MLETRFISCTIEYSRYFRRSIFAVNAYCKNIKEEADDCCGEENPVGGLFCWVLDRNTKTFFAISICFLTSVPFT